ncbi:FIG00553423: hypothetical protein [Cronobacter malonaticus 507]|nr:FIG00553423: hypothetical protein [Cronobacter malonaticus 507]
MPRPRARRDALLMAERGRPADHFAQQPAGAHHAGAAESHMRGGDKPPGQEQVIQRAAVEAAPGDGIGAFAMKLTAAVMRAVDAVRRVQVNRPAAVGHRVVMVALLDNILLAEQVIAHKPAALTLAGNGADPFDREIFRIRELAGVFNVIPYTPDYFPQLPFDLFTLMDGIQTAAPFEPPEIAAVERGGKPLIARNIGYLFQRKRRRNKAHRPAGLFGVEVNRMPELVTEAVAWCHFFAKFVSLFRADAKLGTGKIAQHAVAGGIAKLSGGEGIKGFVNGVKAADAHNPLAVIDDVKKRGVQQQRQPWLRAGEIQQHQIEHHRVALFVAPEVFFEDFTHNAALACPAVVVAHVRGCAVGPQPHFTGGVAAQYRPVLNQNHLQSVASGRQRGAQAGEPAACHQQIGMEMLFRKGPVSAAGKDVHKLVSFLTGITLMTLSCNGTSLCLHNPTRA